MDIQTRQQLKSKEDCAMRDRGWFAHLERRDLQSPTSYNYHTHGFRELGHLDIQIVLPIPPKLFLGIAETIYQRIKEGEYFEDGDTATGIVENFCVRFIKVRETNREVLRVILPGKNGELEPAKLEDDEEPEYALQWTVTVV
ncbi:MAG: DUF4262 domain-containing protein [Promethearchaeota archaeon]|jgi:hypothetical protein